MGLTTGFGAHDPVLRKPTNRRLMDFPGRNRYQVRSSALPHPGISERRTLTTHVHFAFVLVLDLEFLGGIAGRGVHIEGCILEERRLPKSKSKLITRKWGWPITADVQC